jgi:hypothetical protein
MVIVQEWPYSQALGERWVVFPGPVPADQKWPGLQFYATEEEAKRG